MTTRKSRTTTIDAALAAFGRGRLHELVALADSLQAQDLSLDDVRAYLARQRENAQAKERRLRQRARLFARRARRCPACGGGMSLFPVNSGPRDQVGGPWRSQWVCPLCGETLYNTEPPAEILRDMGLAVPAPRAPRTTTPKRRCCNGAA